MVERKIPDYSNYKSAELTAALATVSDTHLPDRMLAIKLEIDRRAKIGFSDEDQPDPKLGFWNRSWARITSINFVIWFLILSAAWVIGAGLTESFLYDAPIFDFGGAILLAMASVSLVAGLLLRGRMLVGSLLALFILLIQSIAVSIGGFLWTCTLLGGVYFRFGSKSDDWKWQFAFDFGEVHFSFSTVAPTDVMIVNVNLLTAILVFVVIRDLTTRRAESEQ